MPPTPTSLSSLRDIHNTAIFRERARQDAREPKLNAWEASLPPCPDWMPRRVWKRLFCASGSRLFVEVWWGKATESGVRVICNRALCCGFNRDECRELVREWLRAKDPDMGWLVFEFDRQYELAVHYLESRGVLRRQREQEREQFFAVAILDGQPTPGPPGRQPRCETRGPPSCAGTQGEQPPEAPDAASGIRIG